MPTRAANRTTETDYALAARLCREVSGDVLFDAFSRGRYATDASFYQIMPAGVVVLRTMPLVVTVLDARGCKKALAAQDGTSLMRGEIAHGKAYGALALGMALPGSDLSEPHGKPTKALP